MARIITISLTEENYQFLQDRMKAGSKASAIMAAALDQIRKNLSEEGVNKQILDLRSDLLAAENKIASFIGFLTETNKIDKYRSWKDRGREQAIMNTETGVSK